MAAPAMAQSWPEGGEGNRLDTEPSPSPFVQDGRVDLDSAALEPIVDPDYTLTWDFDDGTYQGWTVHNNGMGVGIRNPSYFTPSSSDYLALPGDGGLPDSPYATFTLPEATNSWELSALVAWDASNRLSQFGLGYAYAGDSGNYMWYEGRASGSTDVVWGDIYSFDWMGGDGRTVYQDALVDGATGNPINAGEAIMTISYNVPGNRHHITFTFQPISYDASGAIHPMMTSGYCAYDGDDPRAIESIRLGGDYSWAEGFVDNVEFISYGTNTLPPPVVTAAECFRNHAVMGPYTVDVFNGEVAYRQDGPQSITIFFDMPVQQVTGTLQDVVLSSGQVTYISVSSGDPSILTVHCSGVNDAELLTVSFPGIARADEEAATVTDTLCVRVLHGDVNGDGAISIFDLLGVRNRLGTAPSDPSEQTFRADVTANAIVDIFDLLFVRNRLGNTVPTCP